MRYSHTDRGYRERESVCRCTRRCNADETTKNFENCRCRAAAGGNNLHASRIVISVPRARG